MKKAILLAAIAINLPALCLGQNVRVHSQEEMNKVQHSLNSHAGDEAWSSLESIYRFKKTIAPSQLIPSDLPPEQKEPFYPRVKALPSGEYVMYYQGGQVSSRILCSYSSDLIGWTGKRVISAPKPVSVNGARDYERYSNMEMAVLKNRTLLGVQAFRATEGYRAGLGCGLRAMRSHDNGRTWTLPNVIYDGPCWEPYILELPDGTIQVYFTDAHPATRNSGTSVIESTDGGVTFGPKKRIARQFKYFDQGVRIFSDQMPVFRVLNDGKTVFGIVEDRLELDGPGSQSTYWVSTVRNDSPEWKDLGMDAEGPDTKEKNIMKANSGYVVTLPSGETVISIGIGGYHSVKIGDHTATKWNARDWESDWYQPFQEMGCWGNLEATHDKHHIISTMDSGSRGILFALSYLNHRITAPFQQTTLDGNAQEWNGDESLFIGSDSPVETIFRAANDGKNLYVAVESLDAPAEGGAVVSLSICNAEGKLKKGSFVTCTVSADGLVDSSNPEIKAVGKRGCTIDGRKGYVCEVAVPLSSFGASAGTKIYFNATVSAKVDGKTVNDGFFNAGKNTRTWQRILLSDKGIEPPFISSHTGEERFSSLQRMYSCDCRLDSAFTLKGLPETATEQAFACYPRIKKMANGEYIMFYMGGQFGSRIWATRSKDFKTWTEPELLFEPYFVDESDGKRDIRRFVNPDAAVLPNGDVLLVVSFRASNHYSAGIDCGLMTRRSCDNGRTWSEPELICDIPNWEPYLLVLPDGKLHCYFTHAIPKWWNSGTSVLVSEDNGYNWKPAYRVSRQYKYLYQGQKIFTDQMPSFRVLNDGKTIVGFLESRNETKIPFDYKDKTYYASYCKMSMVYNDGLEWKDLGEETEGPARRWTNVCKGAGGYVINFPSGEVIVGCGRGSIYSMKVLDSYAQLVPGDNWENNWFFALDDKGYWGTMEIDGPQTFAVAMHSNSTKGLQLTRFWLNHRLDAVRGKFSDESFYLGNRVGETFLKVSRTDDSLILKSEKNGEIGKLELRLSLNGEDKIHTTVLEGAQGEVSIPFSELGDVKDGDYVCLFASIISDYQRTSFTNSNLKNKNTWQRIRIN